MAPPALNRVCSIEGCGRKHAAHGLCLMHYKRTKKHGSPDYRWGGKEVGRACKHCDRPVVAREMCMRHYQMWHRHGDPLYADSKKIEGLEPGAHMRRGYKMVSPVQQHTKAVVADATVEKTHRHSAKLTATPHGFRDGSKRSRREWEHRKVAGAQPGQIVHHIDGDPLNNDLSNLHVFENAKQHGAAHRSLELLAYDLYRSGVLIFDRQDGVYRLAQSAPR